MTDTPESALYFNAPRLKSQTIEVAPVIEPVKSKRKPLIEKEDEFLDDNLLELDEGTKARNREFQRRLDEIWQSASQYEARLRVEAREAVESILHLKDEYDVHIQEFSSNMQRELKSTFDKFDDVVLPAESSRVDAIEERLDVFIKQTVPATIEAQSGEVSRQLKRAYETFDIEKKKEEKRESKLVTRASKHIQKTGQRFEDESAFISSSFFSVEDDVAECERRAVRNYHHQLDQVSKSIVQINSVSTKESKERMAEDCIVLDTLIDTQKLLQQTVLLHFGSKSDNIDFPPMEKLQARLQRISDLKS